MSGVYIKGMEMPKSCWDCPLINTSPCACKGYSTALEHTTNRHPDCPLVPVPPHGVAVVRCGDCKHYDCEDGDQKCVKDAEWDEETACYYGFVSYHGPEFFCADGERKDGGQDE